MEDLGLNLRQRAVSRLRPAVACGRLSVASARPSKTSRDGLCRRTTRKRSFQVAVHHVESCDDEYVRSGRRKCHVQLICTRAPTPGATSDATSSSPSLSALMDMRSRLRSPTCTAMNHQTPQTLPTPITLACSNRSIYAKTLKPPASPRGLSFQIMLQEEASTLAGTVKSRKTMSCLNARHERP